MCSSDDTKGSQSVIIHVVARRGNKKKEHSRETGSIGYTRRRKTKQEHNTICVGRHYVQTNTNNVNKT
jgi:hypothetical protein